MAKKEALSTTEIHLPDDVLGVVADEDTISDAVKGAYPDYDPAFHEIESRSEPHPDGGTRVRATVFAR